MARISEHNIPRTSVEFENCRKKTNRKSFQTNIGPVELKTSF